MKIIFGNSPNLSSISLPLLVYHPTQIILGSVLVPWLQEWVKNKDTPPLLLPPPTSAAAAEQPSLSPAGSHHSSKRSSPMLGDV